MSLWIIYFLVMIPGIKTMIGEGLAPTGIVLIVATLILCAFTVGGGFLGYLNGAKPEEKKETSAGVVSGWKYLRRTGYAYALAALFFVILPSEKQMYVMAGAYTVSNINGIASLPENAVGAANAWLKRLADAAVKDGDAEVASQINEALTAAPVK